MSNETNPGSENHWRFTSNLLSAANLADRPVYSVHFPLTFNSGV
jgi:hypothetical protein